ncbi:MAG TPA: type I-E CRISPR-associated protein Cse1/CasA [Syntrophobacteraceae bacterium]|nr:type I-E CRISPR-associated protein Cse1/CasA [Syntrophobacteraceae bacterium]
MNVAFDCWIPVTTDAGKRILMSLCAVFAEGDRFADLAVRPHERVALMRLFLCVAHAALKGPRDYGEWCEVPKKLPGAVVKYLMDWKDSFELFHPEKPWLQAAELDILASERSGDPDDEKGWSALNKLCLTRASGNNSTLFDQASNSAAATEHTPNEIVLNLLTFQNFFVAGGKASSRVWGNVEMKNPPNPKGGPCSGKSILFTFLRGKDLLESIYLNLNTYEDLKFLYGNSGNWLGEPIWEKPIKSPIDSEAIANATLTHLGRLVPLTRILRVNVDCKRVLLGAGILYPKFQDERDGFHADAFATTVLNSDGERELLSAKPGYSVWRQLHSLTLCRKNSSDSSRGPLCLLNIPDANSCDIIANAMITNPKQAAEIVDLIESVFHIPAVLRTPEGSDHYRTEVEKSEALATRLGWAVETYRKDVDAGWEGRLKGAGASKGELKGKLHNVATIHYWTSVENNLPLLLSHIEAIGTDDAIPTRNAWRKILRAAAREAYEVACGRESPRQMKAFAKGWQTLTTIRNEPGANDNKPREDGA